MKKEEILSSFLVVQNYANLVSHGYEGHNNIDRVQQVKVIIIISTEPAI
jgi:hypothetical protein